MTDGKQIGLRRNKQAPEGRLELTWTNKHLRLIDDLEGSYAWVRPSDWRVAEVRLLENAETVGEVHADHERAQDNLVIEGDALAALRALTSLPEFAKRYVGQVKLAYIDPPFNTGQVFDDYEDNIEHSVWLTMLRDRLEQIKKLLRPDGSVWVHLDDSEVHRARSVLDEVFGSNCFAGHVVWRCSDNSNNDATRFSEDHNSILVYSKSGDWHTNRMVDPARQSHFKNPTGDPRGPYFDGNPLNSPNPRANLMYELVAPDGTVIQPPPNGWRWDKETMRRRMASGEIRWRKDYTGIFRRTYLADHEGLPPTTLWIDLEETGHNRAGKYELKAFFPSIQTSELFATPKPERLMAKIIEVATGKGDLVLDCFVGSGTTAAVAHKLGRRWIAVERNAETLANYTIPRLKKVIGGTDRGGISEVDAEEFVGELPERVEPGAGRIAARVLKAMREDDRLTNAVLNALAKAGADVDAADGAVGLERRAMAELVVKAIESELRKADKSKKTVEVRWSGGGGFRVLRVAPSMFQQGDDGHIYLAGWASCQDRLGQAVAAQLGYDYHLDGSFVGIKGRRRLAVIDGLVSRPVLEALARDLPDGETMEVLGRAVADDAPQTARELVKGSKVRKIPTELLLNWRRTEGAKA
jgi:adenine-specific DNA-methyltransferase